jgi:hypothetical protein
MAVFLVLSALYVIAWGLMFDSKTFRWTYFQWAFFGTIATLSAILALIDLILGIVCRLNFDKGLPNYCEGISVPYVPFCAEYLLVNAQEPLSEDTFIQARSAEGNAYDEKVDFPSVENTVRTFSATFLPSTDIRAPGQTGLIMGPRFFNQSTPPFVQDVDIESAADPSAVRPTSAESIYSVSTWSLIRAGRQHSTSSTSSSTVTTTEPAVGRSRWVIE